MQKLSGPRLETDIRTPKPIGLALVRAALLLCLTGIYGCSSSPPRNMADACEIFDEKDDWYEASQEVFDKWGVPVHVQLAIIHQESRFEHDAKPPREKLFWFIPWFRKSSAYGYAQAQDSTGEWYQRETGNGWADRDDYEDAVDFIGWYGSVSHRKLGISKWDTYRQYLAYHEGHGGYQRASYKKKALADEGSAQSGAQCQALPCPDWHLQRATRTGLESVAFLNDSHTTRPIPASVY